jgi:PhnB protein
VAEKPTARQGYATVSVRLVVPDLEQQVEFLRAVFGADGDVVPGRPVELRIGDSTVMVTEAGVRDAASAVLYVYVDDADAAYERAMAAGALTMEAPIDTPYGDRRCMVGDKTGNIYQIAHVLPDQA